MNPDECINVLDGMEINVDALHRTHNEVSFIIMNLGIAIVTYLSDGLHFSVAQNQFVR